MEIKPFEKYPFIMEVKSKSFQKLEIYKYSPTAKLFFLVTPSFSKTQKTLCLEEVKTLVLNGKFVQYTKSPNIYEKINLAWENWSEDWEWNGMLYSVDSRKPIDEAPYHKISNMSCKIGYYHGKMVWVCTKPDSHVMYCKFESIDVAPDWSKSAWTNKRNVHPILNCTKNCYI